MQRAISAIKNFYNNLTQNPKRSILIFFGIILIIGGICVSSYGMSWDEIQEHDIMLSSVKEYVRVFAGDDAVKDLKLASIEDISTNIERDHGEAVFYITAPLGLIFPDDIRPIYLIKHIYTFLIFFGALICLYLLIKNLTGRRIFGVLGVLLMFLSPRMFAESFYNVKDMVLLCLVIISFYFGHQFIEKKKFIWAVWFGIAAAFTANTRVMGFWLIGLVGLLYIIMMIYNAIAKKEKPLKPFLVGLLAVVVFFVAYYIITPAAWQNPREFFEYTYKQSLNFNRWTGFVLYQGDIYNNAVHPLPWHYIPVMIAITTPIITVLLIAFGAFDSVIGIFRKKIKTFLDGDRKYYLLMLIFVVVPLVTSIMKKSNVYNGWRHFYFVFGPMIVLAVGGVKTLIEIKKPKVTKIITAVICAQLVFSAGWIALHSGLQFAYYNVVAFNCEKDYEQDYWNVSVKNCLEMLVDNAPDGEIVKVSAIDFASNDGLRKGAMMLSEKYAKRVKVISQDRMIKDGAKYLISNPTYRKLSEMEYERYPDMPEPYDYDLYFVYNCAVKVDGRNIMEVYTMKNP